MQTRGKQDNMSTLKDSIITAEVQNAEQHTFRRLCNIPPPLMCLVEQACRVAGGDLSSCSCRYGCQCC